MTEIDLSQFNEECIEQHNFLRSLHGCQPVSYDPIIAQNAQAYAEELAKRDVMEHSEDIPYGENLAYSNKGANGIYKAYDVANSWYGEIEDYDFNSNEEQMDCGHFSQLVWRDTVRAGFGYAKNPTTHNIYVVGQYDPPGNFYGQWADNIPPPIDGTIWRPPPVTDRDIDLNVPEFDFGSEVNNFGSELDIYDRPESHPDSHEYENITKRHSITSIKYKKMDFNEENFRDEILDAHNDIRRRHGAKALKRNEELDRKAQDWAEYLYQKGLFVRNNFKYRNEPVGDSISVLVKNTDLDNPRRFVENWYEERRFYDYDIEPKTINDIRNFAQIVWQDTEELGSGAIGDESGRTYVVCLYWPAGNIRGQFLNNVTETKY